MSVSVTAPPTSLRADIRSSSLWSDGILRIVDQHRRLLFLALGALYLLAFNGQWLIGPDSGLYLTLGRNLATGHGYTYQGVQHQMVYPGLPIVLAALFRFFGSHVVFAADIFVLLCGLGTLALTYRLFDLALDRPTAVIVTMGLGISYEFYRYCYEILTDIPFAMGVVAVLAGHEAIFHRRENSNRPIRWWDWALLIGGLIFVVTMRPTMIGFLLVWFAAMFWSILRGQGTRGPVLSVFALAFVAILVFARLDPRGAVSSNTAHSYEQSALMDLTNHFAQRLRHEVPDNIKDLFGQSAARSAIGIKLGARWLNAIFGTAILAAGLMLIRIRPLWGLWVGITIAMMILFVSHDRYMLEILPLLVAGWWLMLREINRRIEGRWGNLAFIILLALSTGPNVMKDIFMMVNQHYRPFFALYRDGRFEAYVKIAPLVQQKSQPDDFILCPEKMGSAITWLSDRAALGEITSGPVPSGKRLWVLFDSQEMDFRQWLVKQHVTVEMPEVLSINRRGGAPPLLLCRGRKG